ncbi:MAG TPA: SusC/RagA family TonB-linked outer membrane protein [Gemmatimonadales bacterium]|nr:SusC/RagA family TonB-linked outer membrane protein [Gemmatimonadales bacterium]
MRIHALVLGGIALLLGPAEASAQARIITGTVTDSLSDLPVSGGMVTVRGTSLEALIHNDGTFSVGAPAGEAVLTVRSIGFRQREVTVPAMQNEVRIRLVRDVFRLEEVVITGQATGIQRFNLANAVATVSGEQLERVPAQSVEHALQGKVAGANIQTNSGAPGGGAQVMLRGVTSIIGESAPLYVVDGVVVSDVAIPSNQNEVTRAAGGSNPALTQDAQVNRLADLNPYDIESIEILKGASAAAIYGAKASSGVVIITTRRGQSGSPQINLSQRFGVYSLSNKIGSRVFETEQEAVDAYGASAGPLWQATAFDHEQQLAGRNDLSFETQASVSGGTEATRYYLSGVWKDDEGIVDNTGFDRQALRVNLDQRFGDRWNVSVGSNVNHTLARRGLTNNDNAGVSWFMVFPFTPNFVDLQPDADGLYPDNPFIESNPLQTAALMKNDEDVWRILGSARVTFEAVRGDRHSLRVIGVGGADYFAQKNSLLFPPELQFERIGGQPGTALLSNSHNLNLNVSGNLVHTFTPASGSFSATTSAGVQYATSDLNTARITSRNLSGGLGIVNAGTTIGVLEQRSRIEDLGVYLQEELLMMDERLLLTAGVRADQSSANSDTEKLFVFPKAAASYRLTDRLKARLAYGESGNRPLYGQKFTPISPRQNIEGLPTLVVQGTVGDEDLRPERQRELEGGVDVTFLRDRATLELTGFQKNISDLLLQRTLAPSSGFATQVFNGGKMRVRGLEAALGLVVVQKPSASWVVRTTFATNRSNITELPVPAFLTGGFGTALGAFRIEEGASATQIVGNDTTAAGADTVRALGDANPDFKVGISSDLRFGPFAFFANLDWQQGGDVINLTKLLYDFGQNTYDYDVVEPDGQLRGERRLAGFGRVASHFIEDASFLKVRELTLSYDLPRSVVSRLFGNARYARLSISGRNLLTFTGYTGHDPEVSNFGNQNVARNIDVAPFPPSRSFWFAIDLGL